MKTKKGNVKKLTSSYDYPSVKTASGIFLVPELEVHVWPNNAEILSEWEEERPNIEIAGDLWGFCDVSAQLRKGTRGPVRIHTRSVRSHGSREEFYHTLGHELAHVLEFMEGVTTPTTMQKARWRRLSYEIKSMLYSTRDWLFYQLKRRWEES